jgi:hypothetical protein
MEMPHSSETSVCTYNFTRSFNLDYQHRLPHRRENLGSQREFNCLHTNNHNLFTEHVLSEGPMLRLDSKDCYILPYSVSMQ